MSEHWYVIHSKPRKEDLLWEQLCIRKIEAYYPRLQVKPVNPRARKVKPYFSGYVFAHVDLQQVNLSTLQWMPGARGLVSFGGTPASIPDSLLQAIRNQIEQINAAGGLPAKRMSPGAPVLIRGGIFDGYEAIFDAYLPGSERVRVLLSLLAAQHKKVELPARQIEALQRG